MKHDSYDLAGVTVHGSVRTMNSNHLRSSSTTRPNLTLTDGQKMLEKKPYKKLLVGRVSVANEEFLKDVMMKVDDIDTLRKAQKIRIPNTLHKIQQKFTNSGDSSQYQSYDQSKKKIATNNTSSEFFPKVNLTHTQSL